MLQDDVKEQQQLELEQEEQLLMEEALNSISIPSQLLDFSDDAELFPRDLLQSSVIDGTNSSAMDPTAYLTSDELLNAMTDTYGYANAGYPSVGPPPVFEDYVGMGPTAPPSSSSCFFLDPGLFSRTDTMVGPTAETGMALQEMAEYLNDDMAAANYGMEGMQYGYNPEGKLKILGDCQQQQQLASDQSTLEEYPTFKVGRLSAEERKEKIHRYMRKRNERNFSKKIKYACRKTLADSRPRVRGRFAKNEEFGETARPSSSNNEYNDDDEVLVKEEDRFNSSVMLAHISGVNSFSYKYTVESSI